MVRSRHLISSVAAVFLAAGLSRAQGQPAPLAGPKVKESKIPGVNERFGDKGQDLSRRKETRGIPPEVIRRAVATLNAEGASAETRLSDDQRRRIDALVAEFRESVEAYKRDHRAEIEELRRSIGPEKGMGRPPKTGGDESMRPNSEKASAAQTRLAELRAGAPSPIDLQTRVWNELTDPQRAAVQAEVDKWITEREGVRARDYVHKRLDKKGGADRKRAKGAQEKSSPEDSENPSRVSKPPRGR